MGWAPAWDGSLADPDVIRVGDTYYAYGTDGPEHRAMRETGREVPCLRSSDLEDWEWMGGVLVPPENARGLSFWAPEVLQIGDAFHMFYSCGEPEGQGHKLRVAISTSPDGPFLDIEHILMPSEAFTIDAHPFRDPRDGQLYLFFCKDFFDEPVGTGIACIGLEADGIHVSGERVPILRAQADWQIYERNRFWYGQSWSKWHTVEGPFVIHRNGRYWLFYSGGLWKGQDYGIGCAVSSSVTGPYVDAHILDGPGVLKTQPDLIGPGHCSVFDDVSGELFMAFHAWNAEGTLRQMYVRGLGFDGERWSVL